MMKLIRINFIICLIAFCSCSEIIEPDLTDKQAALIAPQDNYNTSIYLNTFTWNKVEGATKYRLQIASPAFFLIQQMVLDTIVEVTNFSYALNVGDYQWRVMPMNESSQGVYVTRNISVLGTSDLSGQTLVLTSPANNYITNQLSIDFTWDTIQGADEYRFQVINSSSVTVVDLTIAENHSSQALMEDIYTWQVRAQNSTSNTLYSSRVLTIDTAAPPVSTFVTLFGDTISTPDTLFWSRNVLAFSDSIFIYQDSLMNNQVLEASVTDQFYIFSGTAYQKYFWKLRSMDQAGNVSAYSQLGKFHVIP